MLLFFFFLFCLAASVVVSWVGQRRPGAPFLWLASITGYLFRENKVFMVALTGAICLHLSGNVILGAVKYNTSGFTIITHTMCGFFVRELIARIDRGYPFIDRIRSRLPARARRYVTPSTLAFACCGVNAIQEEIWELIRPGMWPTRFIHVADQLADLVCDTTGIMISLNKEWFAHVFGRVSGRATITDMRDSIEDSADLE